jgi:hypothetical protein
MAKLLSLKSLDDCHDDVVMKPQNLSRYQVSLALRGSARTNLIRVAIIPLKMHTARSTSDNPTGIESMRPLQQVGYTPKWLCRDRWTVPKC